MERVMPYLSRFNSGFMATTVSNRCLAIGVTFMGSCRSSSVFIKRRALPVALRACYNEGFPLVIFIHDFTFHGVRRDFHLDAVPS